MWKCFVAIWITAFGVNLGIELEETFSWEELSFEWPSEETEKEWINNGDYVPENNLPLGLDRWQDKLFITIPRWRAGVAATLNYIPLNSTTTKSPSLIPYPSWRANTLPRDNHKPDEDLVVSTFRVKVDACDRLWVMETGLADIYGAGKQVTPLGILVFDLKTDQLIRRYDLKSGDRKEDSFFVNIIVDADPKNCDKTFAYLPDLGAFTIVVYSWAENDTWLVKHNFFRLDPLQGDYNIGGVNFQWPDGILGMALGPQENVQDRTLYFHPTGSTYEFSVSTSVLKNRTLATSPHNYRLFKVEGNRGNLTQATASDFDPKTGVLFTTQINRDGIACWNTKKPLNPANFPLLVHNNETMIFTNHLIVDEDRTLWFISNKMPVFQYGKLDPKETNYRIFKVKVDDLIKDTVCQA